ncbi:TIGR04222 domain-containing membrane protein [Actinosynnema pretiosum subsp. pretiosum]|uniref:TIGR04222 domain-containing membrane protein n=1 Tax=Actinosynnema pretiosum subsp. pretiosum TaxID=103721 RepID=A0AA45R699_9PSEU|nr:TIGR04222 domain-containing membrane protein [Actinosynnema pretiosum subsp. pretiosum]
MMRPWGLSGPEFLELYWIALGVALALAVLTRWWLRGTRGADPAAALTLPELAYLVGGPLRAAEVATAALLDAGALRPGRNRTVSRVKGARPGNPVEAAVLADAARYERRTLPLLLTSVADGPAVREVERRLVLAGLLISPERARKWLRIGVLPMLLVALVGVVRWVNGVRIDAPVGWLTLQLLLTAVLVFVLGTRFLPRRTARGVALVADARTRGLVGGWGAFGPTSPAVEAVLFHGFSAHPDAEVRNAVRPTARSRSWASSGGGTAGVAYYGGFDGGGSGSSGGGDGGGGGGCGGGGGGGCGGGGSS